MLWLYKVLQLSFGRDSGYVLQVFSVTFCQANENCTGSPDFCFVEILQVENDDIFE